MIEVTLIVLAFLFGVGTFFSPCAVALLPAYVGYFAGLAPGDEATQRPDTFGRSLLRGTRFGAAAVAGILGIFGLFGAVIYVLRITIELPSHLLARGLEIGGIVVGIIVLALGILMILGRAPSWTPRISAPATKTVPSMMLFGGLYSLASLGCSLPLFFSVLVQAVLEGPVGGAFLIGAFALGFAGLMFVATIVLVVAERPARRSLTRIMPYVRPVSGALLVAAGLFVLYYYVVLTPAI